LIDFNSIDCVEAAFKTLYRNPTSTEEKDYSEASFWILLEILKTLRAMKQQEFDYWEAWKKAKTAEQNSEN